MCRFIGLDVLTRRSWGVYFGIRVRFTGFRRKKMLVPFQTGARTGFFGDRLLRLSLFSLSVLSACAYVTRYSATAYCTER